MDIPYTILPKQKPRKSNLEVKIVLYRYMEELYEELQDIGIIERVKKTPQLGNIKVNKNLAKTRYDYIMLQLYLHQLINEKLRTDMELAYGNVIKSNESKIEYRYIDNRAATIGDFLQLLILTYNIGHFYNTFTSSRAITMLASEDEAFFDLVTGASPSERFQNTAKNILLNKNYQRLHLLNSILVLEKCDQTKPSVSLALEILYSYMNEGSLAEDKKLRYVFDVFRVVRNIAYIAYDLQIAETPFTIDLCNETAMVSLLKELLSQYNDTQPYHNLIQSISKMLDDTVYYEKTMSICYYRVSRTMVTLLRTEPDYLTKSYYDLFADESSILNRTYSQKKDYVETPILKLTFPPKHRQLASALFTNLEVMNNTRVGYYDRYTGEKTILVSISKRCDEPTRKHTAFKVMKCVIQHLRRTNDIDSADMKYLLCVKFFLFYLFDENPVEIKPTINREKCVICTRGKSKRIKEIQSLLHTSIGNDDANHEVDFLLSQLINDSTNDTSITIPASILVYKKHTVNTTLCEFDGMIIHPMRETDQIVFLESKNRNRGASLGKNSLVTKFDKLSITYSPEDIQIVKHDAYYKYTVK